MRRGRTGSPVAGAALAALLLALAASFAGVRPARGDEPWEAEVRAAEQEEDRLLEEARRQGTTRQLANRYASRVSRQPTALNYYLLGRALYHDGDAEGAERQLRRTLDLEPRFWFARVRLALLEMQRQRPAEAERHLAEVLRARPKEPDALKLLAQIRMDARDWDRALLVLEDILSIDPSDLVVRQNVAAVLMQKGDWARAVKELRVLRGRKPEDLRVRWSYATALFETGDLVEAGRELEGLVHRDPTDLRALDMLRVIYARQEDWKALQRTLERMLPLIEDPSVADRIREMLARLAAGETGPGGAGEASEEWPKDSWMDLVERCMDPADVQARRQALQTYYERRYPRVPSALVRRLHPDHEPDAVCRAWVLRIVGSLGNAQLAQVAAFGLRDPESSVRAIAAETIGEIKTPSGILYLMPFLLARTRGERTAAQDETDLNAARAALVLLTGRRDAFGGPEDWVPAASLDAMREDWAAYFASPEGVHVRLRAIADLEAQGDIMPEVWLIEDVSDPDLRIARAAYEVLQRRSRKPSDDALTTEQWALFPQFGPERLTEEGMPAVRGAVQAWWKGWLEAVGREAAGGD